MKKILLSVAMQALAPGPATSQEVQLQSAVQVDCSAYQRNADGRWIVIRANKMFERGKLLREVLPGEDLEKRMDGDYLYRLLNAACMYARK